MSRGTKFNLTSVEIVEQCTLGYMGKIKFTGSENNKIAIYMLDVSSQKGVVGGLKIIVGNKPVPIVEKNLPESIVEEMIKILTQKESD